MMTLSILLKTTAVLAAVLVAAWSARRSRAALRHLLLASGFAMLLLLPGASLISPRVQLAVPSALEDAIEPLTEAVTEVGTETRAPVPLGPVVDGMTQSTRWRAEFVRDAWALGVGLFLLPVIAGLTQVRRLRRTATPWPQGQAMADALTRRRVAVLLSDRVPGPMTCGTFRPIVILPLEATSWSDADLSRALVHELEHVRRHDWLTQCVTRVIAATYWFHPLVWIAWRRFALEAERACDDAVLCSEERADETAYADQLVHLAQRLRANPSQIHLAMAARRHLSTRIAAVLDQSQRRGRAGQISVLAASTIAAILVLAISPLQIALRGQSQSPTPAATTERARYDVASIKPCQSVEDLQPGRARGAAGGTNAAISPGRFTVPCVTLEQLVYLAYASYGAREDERLENDYMGTASDATKIRGGPDWVHSHKDKWAIEATAAGVTDRYVLMGTMLRTLLEERFKLKQHRELETVPMYALRLAKGGVKIKPISEAECEKRENEPASLTNQRCGLMLHSGGPITRMHYVGFRLSALARVLAQELGVHVVDETGVSDRFIIDLDYVSEQVAAKAAEDPTAAATLPGGGATVFTALEEQLGVKIEKISGRRGFIVIDHAERPSPDEPAPMRAQGPGPLGR